MNALTIAKYVISFAIEKGSPISDLQLQKILYFLNGEYYHEKGRFLFEGSFVAYPLGPVNEEVYRVYKGYGASKIFDKSEVVLDSDVDRALVDRILERRVRMPARQLVDESHTRGKAWDRTVNVRGLYSTIDQQCMREEFENA